MNPGDRRDEVSSRVSQNALETTESSGWPVRPAWREVGLDEARLRAPGGWLSWDEYVRMLTVLAGPGADAARHAELGAAIMRYSATSLPFRHLGQLFTGAEALYRGVYGWTLHATIKVARARVEQVAPRRIRIEIVLDPDAAPGEVFFWSASGTMRVLPMLLGLDEADVAAEVTTHRAVYEVRLPRSRTLLARVRRAWAKLVEREAPGESMDELREGVVSMVEDLRATNARLAVAEARWRAVTQSVPGVVAIFGPDGALEGLHGAAPVVDGDAFWTAMFEEDRPIALAALARCRAGGAQAEAELRTREADGTVRSWACRAAPVPGDGDRVVVVAIDVTRQRAAEAALRESERRFLRLQGMEVVGRVAGGLAHDINNALAAVRGHAELLTLAASEHPDVTTRTARILVATERAAALTRRVLESANPRPATPAVVDLHAALRDAAATLQRLIGEDVALVLTLAPEPVHVVADPTGIERVLLNLAVNARDALPGGGHLHVGTVVEGDTAVLTVRDDGTGMTPEVLARVFEPFFTTKPSGVGSGLGLPTVREIVREAGGSVEVESTPGAGTTVRVRLPCADGGADDPVVTQEEPLRSGQGRRLVLVEDQDEVRDAVHALLEQLDYRVTACAGGAEALAVFARGEPVDALVTDIVMPGMSGLDLVRALEDLRPGLPVLLITGFTAEDPGQAAGLGRRRALLRKPFGLAALSAALGKLLAKEEAI